MVARSATAVKCDGYLNTRARQVLRLVMWRGENLWMTASRDPVSRAREGYRTRANVVARPFSSRMRRVTRPHDPIAAAVRIVGAFGLQTSTHMKRKTTDCPLTL